MATTFNFSQLDDFSIDASGRTGSIEVARGMLSVDGESREVPDPDGSSHRISKVEMWAANQHVVQMHATSPITDGLAETELRASRAKHVVFDEEDQAPSQLDRVIDWDAPWFIILWLGLLFSAVLIPIQSMWTHRGSQR
jgi:hypothetical protein